MKDHLYREDFYVVESRSAPQYKVTPPELLEIPDPTAEQVAQQIEEFFTAPTPAIGNPMIDPSYRIRNGLKTVSRYLAPIDRFRRYLIDPHIHLTQDEYYELIQSSFIKAINQARTERDSSLFYRTIWVGTPSTFLEAIKLNLGTPENFQSTVDHEQEHLDALVEASNTLGGNWYGSMFINLYRPPVKGKRETYLINVNNNPSLSRRLVSAFVYIAFAPRDLVNSDTFLEVSKQVTLGTVNGKNPNYGTYGDKKNLADNLRRRKYGINGLSVPIEVVNNFAELRD